MKSIEFNFNSNSFNKLFPFYILIDDNLQIISFGKSLTKISPSLKEGDIFSNCFIIKRPRTDLITFEELYLNINKLTIIECIETKIELRGQFEINDNSIIFIGSPWFTSMKQLMEKKIMHHDFAPQDPLLDLLHILNNQENTSNELKELLTTINDQKNKLKQANKEIHDIALFPTQNPDPLIRIDTKGNLLKRNPAAEKLTSFVYDGISYETEDFFKFIVTKIDLDKERWIFEAQNNQKYYSFVCKSLKDLQYVNIYGRDITLQKKAEEELNRLSLVASANRNGVVFTEPNGIIVWCNDAYIQLTGFSREEIIGKTPVEIGKTNETHKNDLQKMIEPFYKGIPFDVDLMHGRKDGSSFWSKNKGQPILNSKGEVIQFFAMIEDISLKKRYDESLQNEKEKYRSIIANMNLGLLEVDNNDCITLANQSFINISGYELNELIGKKAAELLLTKESQDLVKSKISNRENGKTDSYEVKIIDKFGKKKNWLISGAPNYNGKGELIGTIGIHLDITEQKEQEEQLYLLSLIAEKKNLNAVIIADADGKIEWVNKSFIDMTGYSMEELIGKKPGHLLQGEDTDPVTIEYMRDRIHKGLPFNCEIINYSKQGEKYWINVQGQALYNKKGQISKFFAIEENITEKKEFQEKQAFLVKRIIKQMKILIIDDQELVLLSIEKCLNDLGYEVLCAKNVADAIEFYDKETPNLVITDINLSGSNNNESETVFSGLDIVKYIKITKNHKTPVIILTGSTDENVLSKGFELGIDDFMKKPLSFTEIAARVKKLIGSSEAKNTIIEQNRIVQTNVVGVVIPCYNEETRLLSDDFKSFVHKNLGYHLCFVNDGSKDNTLQVLKELAKGNDDRISIYDCEKNGGKAEAVRLGMLHLAKQSQFNYIGFLDADLSTDFEDFNDLVTTISSSNFKIVSGSRINRMGADITKQSARAIISKTINFFIRKTLGMDFKDTQCGAKIMTKEIVEKTFQKKFLTKWLFDVEIFMRMKKIYGANGAQNIICEQPLKRWIHADGSKLSFKDSLKIVFQILQIAVHYR